VNQQILQNIVSAFWLLIAIYDIAVGLPDGLHAIVAIGWLIVVGVTIKWASIIHSTVFVKFSGLFIAAFVIFVSFGQAIDFLAGVSPKFDQRYQNIILVLAQSIVASIFTAAVISVPLVAVYRKYILGVVLLVSAPIIIFQVHGIVTSGKVATQLILAFEITFRIVAVWVGCSLASKALTKASTGQIKAPASPPL
jgi:hypothetical protein